MTNVFFSNYNIEELMRYLFNSDWFYSPQYIGTKIKSPIDFYIGIQKTVPFKFVKKRDLLVYQRILGQVLLNPPNVAGWKGGRSWIDSSTIVFRLRLPSIILNKAQISTKAPGDFNDTFQHLYEKSGGKKLPFKAKINWEKFNKTYEKFDYNNIQEDLCLSKLNEATKAYLDNLSRTSKKEYCVQLMSLPEYQMC